MAYHEIWWTDENGYRIAGLTENLGGYFGRITNGIGPCLLTMPGSFDWKALRPDQMIQYWRAPEGGRFGLWRSYFLRAWNPRYQDGELVIDIKGVDAVDLLRRRVVAAYNGSANALKATTEADDMMKDIIADMESDVIAPTPTAGTRAWASFSTQGDLTLGPQLDQSFAWRNVLDLLRDLAMASREAGTEVFFTVDETLTSASTISFVFRTTTGQPGMDRSSFVVFDAANQTLIDPNLEYDYREEINYVYGLGPGEMTNQNVQQAYSAARYGVSKWARCEGIASANGEDTDNGVREAARIALTAGRPRIIFSGNPVDSEGLRFGVDWNWGDKVMARAFGHEFKAILRKVFVRIDADGQETVESRLEYES